MEPFPDASYAFDSRRDRYGSSLVLWDLLSRVLKDLAREIRHTFGPAHCREESCPMSLSAVTRQADAGRGSCSSCRASPPGEDD